jgi:hypothetical protein
MKENTYHGIPNEVLLDLQAHPPCKYGRTSSECLCQICEDQCNNGFNCATCDAAGKAEHNIYLCTGFTGTYPDGMTSDEVHKRALEILEDRRKNNG